MVYCGKPSGGCHACRQKKTRCDQRPEGCSQCERMKRVCPGYRAIGDVIFRNESDNVIRKFKAKEGRAKKDSAGDGVLTPLRGDSTPLSSSSSDSGLENDSLEIVQQNRCPFDTFSLAPSLEDRAATYFVYNYIVDVQGPTRGHMDYITSICGEGNVDESLLAGMKAVGLASFAHSQRAPSLQKHAQYQYWKAIRATNAALQSPSLAKRDSTLSSIMILGVYETVTGTNQKSIHDWAEHIKGATALLKLRGLEQLTTVRGRRMFVQVVTSLMITCLHQSAPLPDFVIEWTKVARQLLPSPEPAFEAQETMMKFTMFRAAIRSGKISDPAEIISGILEIDEHFVDLFTTRLPPDWVYEIVHTDVKANFVWDGKYHIYHDYWVSQVWNAMRTMRMLIHETIRDTLIKGFAAKPPLFTAPEYLTQYQSSTNILSELACDVLATVPQHLGYVPSKARYKTRRESFPSELKNHESSQTMVRLPWTDSNEGFEFNDLGEPTVKMTGPYFLLWPLWLAGVVDVATPEMKQFVATNLRNIGTKMGIKQAIVLAKVVETDVAITSW